MITKLIKKINRATKYFRAIRALEGGRIEHAIALLEDLETQLSGKSAEYHLHLAKAYFKVACSDRSEPNLIMAKKILDAGGKYSDADKEYLIRYTHELLLDQMPDTYSSATKIALRSALPKFPDLERVDASLMRVFPVGVVEKTKD